MSGAKVCDRCGQTIKLFGYDDNMHYEMSQRDDSWRYEITKDCYPYPDKIKIDLCINCKKDLLKWLKENNK